MLSTLFTNDVRQTLDRAASGKRCNVGRVYFERLIVALQRLFMSTTCLVCLANPEIEIRILRPQSKRSSVAVHCFIMTAHHAQGVAEAMVDICIFWPQGNCLIKAGHRWFVTTEPC